MKKDYSYGIIPIFINENGKKEFLVINQKTENGYFFGFPKGHGEEGETEIESAKRELKEEVGICDIEIDENNMGILKYNFVIDNIKYNKTVKYWLGYTKTKKTKIQNEELNSCRRLKYEQAIKKITHNNMKKLFKNITSKIQ